MMWLIAQLPQLPLPEVPKSGDIASWFGWVMTVLALVIACALAFLVNASRKSEDGADKALERLVNNLEKSQQSAEERLNKAWVEHEKDRVAFTTQQEALSKTHDEVARTLSTIATNSDKNQSLIVSELREIKEHVIRRKDS